MVPACASAVLSKKSPLAHRLRRVCPFWRRIHSDAAPSGASLENLSRDMEITPSYKTTGGTVFTFYK